MVAPTRIDSADILVAFAKKLSDPRASPVAQLLATGAVLSLGRRAPPNLKETLARRAAKTAPPQARRAAAALGTRQTCRTPVTVTGPARPAPIER